ncbi:MAG: ABC transporter ATP-binding protein [Rhodospirillales bacterium]|nr:ABC transporter ATP-binding protein [Rhodospirillales bacterium]
MGGDPGLSRRQRPDPAEDRRRAVLHRSFAGEGQRFRCKKGDRAGQRLQVSHGHPFIGLASVGKNFRTRSGDEVCALKDITLAIEPQEFVSIVGPSGCGKSTLLRIIAGLIAPSEGAVHMAGARVEGPRRDIGMVFQAPVLLPWRTNLKNVLVPAEVIGFDRRQSESRARELLDLVGLGRFADKYPSELSGGMRQRVSIARALMHDPATLLMDEPFGALDAMTRESMGLELLRIWNASRKTVILVTHSIEEAVFLADRVIVMSSRPGTVSEAVDVGLKRPRTTETRADGEFVRLTNRLRGVFETLPPALH